MSTLSVDTIVPKHASRTMISKALISEGTLSNCTYARGYSHHGTLFSYSLDSCRIDGSLVDASLISASTLTSPIVNGGTFADFSAELSVTSGSYTCTGLASDTTGTPAVINGSYRIALLDPFVHFTLQECYAYGNGDNATFELYIPENLRPALDHYAVVYAANDRVPSYGLLHVTPAGVVTIGLSPSNDAFTNAKEAYISTACTMWPIA